MKIVKIIIVSSFLLLWSCSNDKQMLVRGTYVVHVDREIFISKSDNGTKVFLDTISKRNQRDINVLFYPYDSLSMERAIDELCHKANVEQFKYIGLYTCNKMDDTSTKYYVVLYSDYKNRWYERNDKD